MMKAVLLLPILLLLSHCRQPTEQTDTSPVPYDAHVHLMSPALITYWKGLGISFSRPDAHYADIDTILANSGAERIDLVGMGYVFTNPEYYQGTDGKQKLQAENDYLLRMAGRYPDRVRPFFAVDPLSDFALEEMKRCHAIDSTAGLKLHFNASQVYLTVQEHLTSVRELLAAAAEYRLPVLLHFDNLHPEFGKPDIEILVESVLAKIQPLTLRIAHFGTSGGFDDRTAALVDAFLELRNQKRIPPGHQLYFDISAVALDKDSEGVSRLSEEDFDRLGDYVRKIGLDHILFGTDYPLYMAEEYREVLSSRLQLTDEEIRRIMKPK